MREMWSWHSAQSQGSIQGRLWLEWSETGSLGLCDRSGVTTVEEAVTC